MYKAIASRGSIHKILVRESFVLKQYIWVASKYLQALFFLGNDAKLKWSMRLPVNFHLFSTEQAEFPQTYGFHL